MAVQRKMSFGWGCIGFGAGLHINAPLHCMPCATAGINYAREHTSSLCREMENLKKSPLYEETSAHQ